MLGVPGVPFPRCRFRDVGHGEAGGGSGGADGGRAVWVAPRGTEAEPQSPLVVDDALLGNGSAQLVELRRRVRANGITKRPPAATFIETVTGTEGVQNAGRRIASIEFRCNPTDDTLGVADDAERCYFSACLVVYGR